MSWKFWKGDDEQDHEEQSDADRRLEELRSGAASSGAGFRLEVQDVFTITGRGTVVTGEVASGAVTEGMPVTLTHPDGTQRSSTVTGVETFRRRVDSASVGENVGLLLADVQRDEVVTGSIVAGR